MIKVLIVDDMVLIRKSVKLLIDGIDNVHIIGECGDGQDVIGFVTKNAPSIILMDVTMPFLNGIEATKLVVNQFPRIKVIAHSSHTDDECMRKMREAGAIDYLVKNQNKKELINAIHRAYHG